MRTRLGPAVLGIIALTSVLRIGPAAASAPDDWEWPGVGVGTGGEYIRDMIVWNDGSGEALYVGGLFTSAGGVPAAGVTRWNGEEWSLFGGLAGEVTAMVPFDDGSGPALYAGGNIGSAGGVPAKNVARWNGEKWSPVGQNILGTVHALTVYDDGFGARLYAGGTTGLWRWDLQTWTKILGPLTPPIVIRCMATFDNAGQTKLCVGGGNAPWVAAWDGQVWTSIGLPPGYFGTPTAMVSFDDGMGARLFVAGPFNDGSQYVGIFAWDGTEWTPVPTGILNKSHYNDFVVAEDRGTQTLYAIGPPSAVRWGRGVWVPLGNVGPNSGPLLAGAVFNDGSGARLHIGGSIELEGTWKNIARQVSPKGAQCGDLTGDGFVNQQDLGILLGDWGCTKGVGLCPGDCDGDGDTDQADLGIVLSNWEQPCP